MAPLPAAPPIDVERFYALTRDWDRQAELLDGEVHVVPAPSHVHQVIAVRLVTALEVWATGRPGIRPSVLVAPVDVRLDRHTVVQPDVAVWTGPFDLDVRPAPPPQLAVEVLSPTSRRRDVGAKRAACARAAVPELWLVDPEDASVTLLREPRPDEGTYALVERTSGDEAVRSPGLPGFAAATTALFPA